MSNNKDWTGDANSVWGCLGASSHFSGERETNDYYATDPKAAEWLIKLENLHRNIWECACGQGHLAKVFEANGYNVMATDLIDRGYGVGGYDFLAHDGVYIGDIVTNPPYKYAQEFVEHALNIIPDGYKVCMFLKVTFLEGKSRKKMFEKYPPDMCMYHQAVSLAERTECLSNLLSHTLGMFGKRVIKATRF